ncbi:MAG TPA: cytochrome b/b6 domain-containing protein [Alphaproteobacteria bacterium]|jgi:thiosulfate reductase cytochrome b subunit|nr:cytochrome b/b6 domain-containing protein [Alphaproteobacteria bacterium]
MTVATRKPAAFDAPGAAAPARPAAHPLPVRIMHWLGAAAILCMILSGWQIYNASPLLPFEFPSWMTLGGWLAGGIAWHLAGLWLLLLDGLLYLIYGFASGHFRRDFLPLDPRLVLRDLGRALTGRLAHRLGHYNAVQRLLYAGVLVVVVFTVLTGLSIWKPVQFAWLTDFFGGYDRARVLHFSAMCLIVAFLAVHLILVAIFPRTLLAMIAGLRRQDEAEEKP